MFCNKIAMIYIKSLINKYNAFQENIESDPVLREYHF